MNRYILQKIYGLKEANYDYHNQDVVTSEDEITMIIFAPNPRTGFADNSLQLQLSEKTDRAIREYLEQFNKPLPVISGAPDDESALDMCPPSDLSPESIDNYYQRLSEIANANFETKGGNSCGL